MYALRCGSTMFFKFPNKEYGPFGFDLEMMDWVAPHGKGKIGDFILEGILDDPRDKNYSPKGTLKLSFSNPLDGILEVESDSIGGSVLITPSEAPASGYSDTWIFKNKIDINNPQSSLSSPPKAYIFRVRTKADESGKLTEARYGKIYGNVSALLSANLPSFKYITPI